MAEVHQTSDCSSVRTWQAASSLRGVSPTSDQFRRESADSTASNPQRGPTWIRWGRRQSFGRGWCRGGRRSGGGINSKRYPRIESCGQSFRRWPLPFWSLSPTGLCGSSEAMTAPKGPASNVARAAGGLPKFAAADSAATTTGRALARFGKVQRFGRDGDMKIAAGRDLLRRSGSELALRSRDQRFQTDAIAGGLTCQLVRLRKGGGKVLRHTGDQPLDRVVPRSMASPTETGLASVAPPSRVRAKLVPAGPLARRLEVTAFRCRSGPPRDKSHCKP